MNARHLAVALLLGSCKRSVPAPPTRPIAHPDVKVVASLVHSTSAFTQGLAFSGGRLFEGTGLVGQSGLRELDPSTGEELRHVANRTPVFGEGITVLGDRIYQLTWKDHVCIVYDARTLAEVTTLPYPEEGWGLTNDGTNLIASDGSATLRVLDPADLHVLRTIAVNENGEPVERLNELELVAGFVWANVWQKSAIVKIDPKTGAVVASVDLAGLLPKASRSGDPDDVLNGIAFDDQTGRLYVTGKRWPLLFQIALN